MSGSTAAEWRPKSNPWLVAVVVTLAAFMEILDTTIVNVSLPYIAGSVSASYDDATWTLTSYLVANGIVLTISGWLGRVIGRKRYFLICIVMFTVFSFLCGTSTSLGEIVFFRLCQGFFGGGLQPNQQAIILDYFKPQDRGRAFGVVAIAVIFAPAIGPTLGGWITQDISWRWIFWINIPVGAFAFFMVSRLVEDPPWVLKNRSRWRDIDGIGLGLIALGLGCLEVFMDRGEDDDWFSSNFITLMAVLAAIGIIGAILWLLVAKKPVVNLRVYADRNFAVGSIMIFSIGAILYSGGVLIPQLAQQQYGYTALLAGLILSPGALVIVLILPLINKFVMPNVQTRFIIAAGFAAMGVGYYCASDLTPNLSFNQLTFYRILQAWPLALLFVPSSTITYSTLPRALNNDGSALYVMMRNVAGSVGISLATATITQRTQIQRAHLVRNLTPYSAPYQQLLSANEGALRQLGWNPAQIAQTARGLVNRTLEQQASILAYTDVFLYCAIAAFLVVPLTFLFRPSVAGRKAAGGGH